MYPFPVHDYIKQGVPIWPGTRYDPGIAQAEQATLYRALHGVDLPSTRTDALWARRIDDYNVCSVMLHPRERLGRLMRATLTLTAPQLVQRVPANALPGVTMVLSSIALPHRQTRPPSKPVLGTFYLYDLGHRNAGY